MLTHQYNCLQVLQQYGAAFVSIQSYNTTQASAGPRKLRRKLFSHPAHDPQGGNPQARRLMQASSSGGMLQVDMMVTVPAEQQLQVLSPGTTNKTSQSLTASGIPLFLLLASSCSVCLQTLIFQSLLCQLPSTWHVLCGFSAASAAAACAASALCKTACSQCAHT